VSLLIVFVTAFEFFPASVRTAGMAAGCAVADWQNGWALNPAVTADDQRLAGSIIYAQPFGLPGLNFARAGLHYRAKMFAITSGLQVLSMEGEQEFDLGAVSAINLPGGWSAGFGLHGLILNQRGYTGDFVGAFDFGIGWVGAGLRLGMAGQHLNFPRFSNGDELKPAFRFGLCWTPAAPLLLALDVEKDAEIERFLAGVEYNLLPELALRAGVETFPFSLRSGLSLRLGGLGLDYGYHYHPQLGDTHILGINLRCN
jgi:hypothetical protein